MTLSEKIYFELKNQYHIEINKDDRGVIGDFTTMSDIRIMKVEPFIYMCKMLTSKSHLAEI